MDLEFKLSTQVNKIILKIVDDENYEELYENRIRELICEVALRFQKAKKVMKYVCKLKQMNTTMVGNFSTNLCNHNTIKAIVHLQL